MVVWIRDERIESRFHARLPMQDVSVHVDDAGVFFRAPGRMLMHGEVAMIGEALIEAAEYLQIEHHAASD